MAHKVAQGRGGGAARGRRGQGVKIEAVAAAAAASRPARRTAGICTISTTTAPATTPAVGVIAIAVRYLSCHLLVETEERRCWYAAAHSVAFPSQRQQHLTRCVVS